MGIYSDFVAHLVLVTETYHGQQSAKMHVLGGWILPRKLKRRKEFE